MRIIVHREEKKICVLIQDRARFCEHERKTTPSNRDMMRLRVMVVVARSILVTKVILHMCVEDDRVAERVEPKKGLLF